MATEQLNNVACHGLLKYIFLEILIYMLICLTLLSGYLWMLFKHLVYNTLHSLLAFMHIGWISLLPDYNNFKSVFVADGLSDHNN